MPLTNAQRAENAAMKNCLMRLRFPENSAVAVIQNCISSTQDLAHLDRDDVRRLCKLVREDGKVVPFSAEKHMQTLRWYCQQSLNRNIEVDLAQYTLAMCRENARTKQQAEALRAAQDTVPSPEKFENVEDFMAWLEGFNTWTYRKIGINNVPLCYITRDEVEPDPEAVYSNEREKQIAVIEHDGANYDHDNGLLYDELRISTLKGPGETYVSRYKKTRDGRRAYMALKGHFLGDAYIDRLIQTCYGTLERATYSGQQRTWSFEKYLAILTKNFDLLEEKNEMLTETRKVRILLKGITDNRLQNAKDFVIGTPTMNNSFTNASNYLSQVIPSRRSMNASRTIAETGRGERGYGGRNRGGRGRSSWRSGRGPGRGSVRNGRGYDRNIFNRGGRGRGSYSTGSSRGYNNTRTNNGWIPYRDWMSMSYDERQRIQNYRRNQNNFVGNQGANYNTGIDTQHPERTMEMLSTIVEDMMERRSVNSGNQGYREGNPSTGNTGDRAQSTTNSQNPTTVYVPQQQHSGQISRISGDVSSLFSSRSRRH